MGKDYGLEGVENLQADPVVREAFDDAVQYSVVAVVGSVAEK